MSDILKQIQALQEQFSNLFEVEGLGNPAVDVPPSQNKIKKDVKTKDGKAELVSVEDELFPYDGNKKEQYRQKIIDTINGMIQGTATLEDLLQIVRQKKAPLKEALEIMEDVMSAIKKKHGEPEFNPKSNIVIPLNKSAELIDKAGDVKQKEYQKELEKNPDVNLYNKRFQTKNSKGEKETKNRSSKYRKFSDDWKLPKTDDEKVEASIKRHEKKDSLKEALSLMSSLVEGKEPNAECEYRKQEWEKAVKKFDDLQAKNTDYAVEKPETKKAYDEERKAYANLDKARRDSKKVYGPYEALEEALSILIEGRKEGESQEDFKHRLHGELVRAIDNKAEKAKKEAIEGKKCAYEKYKKEHDKLGKLDDIEPVANAYITIESLKEAIELMEAIINEVSDKTAQGALDAAQQRYNRKGYEASMKLFQGDSKGAIEDGNKAQDEYNKHLGLQLKRAKRLGKKLVQDKNDHDSFKIEEALSLMEAIINEVSKEFLKDKDDKAKVKVLKAIIRHGETMTPENPEGDPELLKIRQDSIDRLKEYREKCNDYLEKKEKRNDK